MTEPVRIPVVCDMTGARDTLEARMAEYGRLFEAALVGRDRLTPEAIRFRFGGDAGVESWVRDLADREQGCCAFFTMTVTARAGEVWWDLSVPDDDAARQVLELMYQLPDAPAPA